MLIQVMHKVVRIRNARSTNLFTPSDFLLSHLKKLEKECDTQAHIARTTAAL